METIISILLALLSAFLGGYFGAWFQHSFQNRKVNKVRKIAIKALDVFCRYVKQGQTFDKAASEFNNSLDVVEKRAVLVALCKLGIPVVKPINDLFQIYNPQNEMFSHFGTKRYNFKNETQLFKVIPHTSKNQKKSTGFAGTKYI